MVEYRINVVPVQFAVMNWLPKFVEYPESLTDSVPEVQSNTSRASWHPNHDGKRISQFIINLPSFSARLSCKLSASKPQLHIRSYIPCSGGIFNSSELPWNSDFVPTTKHIAPLQAILSSRSGLLVFGIALVEVRSNAFCRIKLFGFLFRVFRVVALGNSRWVPPIIVMNFYRWNNSIQHHLARPVCFYCHSSKYVEYHQQTLLTIRNRDEKRLPQLPSDSSTSTFRDWQIEKHRTSKLYCVSAMALSGFWPSQNRGSSNPILPSYTELQVTKFTEKREASTQKRRKGADFWFMYQIMSHAACSRGERPLLMGHLVAAVLFRQTKGINRDHLSFTGHRCIQHSRLIPSRKWSARRFFPSWFCADGGPQQRYKHCYNLSILSVLCRLVHEIQPRWQSFGAN